MSKRKGVGGMVVPLVGIGVGLASASGLALLAYSVKWEPNRIEITHVDVVLPGLPQSFDGYRIVQISDIHAGKWMPAARLDKIVEAVNGEYPDLIAITGDFVTRVYWGVFDNLRPALLRLRAKDGVAAVLGNHDYWGKANLGPELVRHLIKETGIIDLNNGVYSVWRGGDQLNFAGVDSAREKMDRLDFVLNALPENGPAILLAHEPDFADKSAATGRFGLQLSGHSHGGQISLPILGPPRLPPMGRKYPTGFYRVEGMAVYTNRGVGLVGLPLRFRSRPEVTVLTLRCGDAV